MATHARTISRPDRESVRLLVLLVALVAMAIGAGVGAGSAWAQAPDWELLGPGERVFQLFTPVNGAFFARTATGLWRSDDAGATWQPVTLPPAVPPNLPPPVPPASSLRRTFAVDPTDHQILFASDLVGLQRSTDGGASWMPLNFPSNASRAVVGLSVSPADHLRIYALTLSRASMSDLGSILRSDDGGDTWTVAATMSSGPGCAYAFRLFQAHPLDPDQVFRVGGCYRGAPLGEPLERSADGGASWGVVTPRELGSTQALAGGAGTQPGRFYLATMDRSQRVVHLSRSDADLAGWATVLDGENATTIAVTYDPQAPDTVYVGTSQGGVQASTDGGQTWSQLGRPDLGTIYDLALGIDGANLYAATDQGVWRLALR